MEHQHLSVPTQTLDAHNTCLIVLEHGRLFGQNGGLFSSIEADRQESSYSDSAAQAETA